MTFEKEDFKFPDEQDDVSIELDGELEIDIEDDTPEEDRGREPMPKQIVEDLEKDELESYDDTVKQRLKQLKKVWHDERRAKEQAYREHEEAITLARKLFEENKRMRETLTSGEQEYVTTVQNVAELELTNAKRELKEAFDAGDSDAIVEAQAKLNNAQLRLIRANNIKPTLQSEEYDVQHIQEKLQPKPQTNQPDSKAQDWASRNKWFGQDDEMTATALGIHKKLEKEGNIVIGSDEYYATLDKTMRKRFSDYFEPEEEKPAAKAKPTVVAPAKRSTSSNRITLRQSELQIAKRLGLTPEQYARQKQILETK